MHRISINGVFYYISKEITVDQLLNFLNCNKQAIALEYNYSILKSNEWSKILLKSQDTLEIVTIVGGG